jgi:hypothetical protein
VYNLGNIVLRRNKGNFFLNITVIIFFLKSNSNFRKCLESNINDKDILLLKKFNLITTIFSQNFSKLNNRWRILDLCPFLTYLKNRIYENDVVNTNKLLFMDGRSTKNKNL